MHPLRPGDGEILSDLDPNIPSTRARLHSLGLRYNRLSITHPCSTPIFYSTVQCHIPSHRHGAGSYLPLPSILQTGKLPIFGKNSSQSSPVLSLLRPLWRYSCHSPAVTGAVFSRHYQFLQLLNSTELAGMTCSTDISFSGWAASEDVIAVGGQTCSTARVGQA